LGLAANLYADVVMSIGPFDPDAFDPDALKHIQESISIIPAGELKRLHESISTIPAGELKRIQESMQIIQPDVLKRLQDSISIIPPDELKRMQAALLPANELKRLQDSISIIPVGELKRLQDSLSLQVGEVSALSGLAFAEVPPPAAAAISDFEDLLGTEDSDVTLLAWLEGLTSQVRPSVFVNAVAALVATIQYIQVELGAEPSASVLFLVAALLAIAVFLASLEDAT
jgi:hypothetical protein